VTGQASVLFEEDEVVRRVGELGLQISRDYAGGSPVLVSVLKGGAIFLADLMRGIDLQVSIDFMSISTYAGHTAGAEPERARTGGDRDGGGPSGPSGTSGVVRILKDLEVDIGGRDVIVVEDIVDTGLTLSYLLTTLRTRKPATLEVCTLLDRSVRRIPPLEIRYRGFEIPDVFVVGYGLDHEERYRNLPYIVAVDKQSTLEDQPELLEPFGVRGLRPAGATG
jgi:hypoxanthine phosphoribosyltransferase